MARSTLDIADAVAAEIKTPVGVEWVQEDASRGNFTCESVLLPLWDMEALKTLHVSVIGVEADGERHTRSHVKDMHKILVGVQKAISAKPEHYRDEVKSIVGFLFELKQYWLTDGRRLAAIPSVYCKKAKVHVLYNPENLESENIYEGLVELFFEEIAVG